MVFPAIKALFRRILIRISAALSAFDFAEKDYRIFDHDGPESVLDFSVFQSLSAYLQDSPRLVQDL